MITHTVLKVAHNDNSLVLSGGVVIKALHFLSRQHMKLEIEVFVDNFSPASPRIPITQMLVLTLLYGSKTPNAINLK